MFPGLVPSTEMRTEARRVNRANADTRLSLLAPITVPFTGLSGRDAELAYLTSEPDLGGFAAPGVDTFVTYAKRSITVA